METEIKLQASPEDLDAVLRVIQGIAAVEGAPSSSRLESRYYDTPDRCLAGRKVALRVRRAGERYVQTVKTNGSGGGLFARGEWEMDVASFSPQFPEGPPNLEEVFVTDIRRRTLNASYPPGRPGASQVELAIDTGEIRSAAGRQLVCEVELELLDGKPADLFDLGARIAEQVPLQLSVDSKSARGFRLADDEPPAAVKAEKLEFQPDVSLEDGMRDSFRACIEQWFANQAAAMDGRDLEGVHQMRVALRRLRSALMFFRDFIPDPPLGEFKDESRWIAASLGPARDWDVFLTETLPPLLDMWPEHRGLRALNDAAERARREGYEEARVAMASPAYTVFALRLSGWVERSAWRQGLNGEKAAALARPMAEHARHLLDRLYDKVMRAGRDFDRLDVHEKHELRIVLKKLRYAGEFFRSLFPKKDVKRFRDGLTSLLDDLGKLNDLTVAKALCGRLMDADESDGDALLTGTAALLSWHEERGHVSDKALSRAWADFAAADPFWRSD
ncbi:MAG: CHAD domain-containing protein [Alphaproteobacteria bacterium]|nr:CHAD domain-containing protein [Alphaproteobacteria bacterium]